MYKIVSKILGFFLDLIELVLIGGTMAFFVMFYVGQLLEVTGDSMLPTFKNGEQLVAEKISVKTEGIQRGDIVIFNHPINSADLLIKRVIGMPGEEIMISNGRIFINGNELGESYLGVNTQTLGFGTLPNDTPVIIPQNSYALLGDNRTNSSDTRTWGFVNEKLIIGKSFFVYYPIGSVRAAN